MDNKTYQCSCYVEYPNKSHLNKNGTWKCVDKYEKCEDWKPKSIYGCITHCRRKAQDMERNCNYCVYHSSGSCAAWECTGTKTVDDIRADERRKFAIWLDTNGYMRKMDLNISRVEEALYEYEKEQKGETE